MNQAQTLVAPLRPTGDERLSPLQCPVLAALSPSIRHGFFARQGGLSSGIYAGLNAGLGSNDDTPTVVENRALITAHLGVEAHNLASPYQVHSPDVVAIDADWDNGKWQGKNRPKADGIVTKRKGVAIGVVTADCGPVLFADPKAGVIGACHAGWQGAIGGVLQNTIAAMERLGAARSNITATLGPTISQKNYEVGAEYRDNFISSEADFARYFIPSTKDNHFMFDLIGFIRDRLNSTGVHGSALDVCTYADEASFYSYRRTTHRNEPDYGRQLSAIVIS